MISPDGDALAVLVRNTAGLRQLAIIDTADLHKARIVASMDDYDVERAQWASDKRLVFSPVRRVRSRHRPAWLGLFAVDRDGEDFRTLIRAQRPTRADRQR